MAMGPQIEMGPEGPEMGPFGPYLRPFQVGPFGPFGPFGPYLRQFHLGPDLGPQYLEQNQ